VSGLHGAMAGGAARLAGRSDARRGFETPFQVQVGGPEGRSSAPRLGPALVFRSYCLPAPGRPPSGLLEARNLVRQGRATHVANLVGAERPGPVHRHPVVPHDEVPGLPDVRVDELALGRMLVEIPQEGPRLRYRPTFDGPGVAGQIERQPTGPRMPPDEPLANGCPLRAFGLGEVLEAQHAPRVDLAVQADEVLDLPFGLVVQRF